MFGDFHSHWWKVEYLTLFVTCGFHTFERSTAMTTFCHPVDYDVIWTGHSLEGVPFVPDLTTTLSTTRLAETARAGLLETIAGWRLAAVSAVLG